MFQTKTIATTTSYGERENKRLHGNELLKKT